MRQLRPTPEPPSMPLWARMFCGVVYLGLAWCLIPIFIGICMMFFDLNCKLWSKLLDIIVTYFEGTYG